MRLEIEPWRELPRDVADVIEPELEPMTEEILATIPREVPEYARPFEGSFGVGIRTGVSEALAQFAALVRDPDSERAQSREVYRDLGRGELRQGRTLDSLQAAYRVGARVAWRRLATAAEHAQLETATVSRLAESIFAYIDQLAAESVEGYAEALGELEDERFRRRRSLAGLLVGGRAVDQASLEAAARGADWQVPKRAAVLACVEDELERLRRRLPPDTLVTAVEGLGCVVVPDPSGPGRPRELRRAAEGTRAVLGPVSPLSELAGSWMLARAALAARSAGVIGGEGLVLAEEHLSEVLLSEGALVVAAIARRRLRPLDALTDSARARMEATALAYVQHGGNAAAMGRALNLHPQTIRHRLRRLSELLGEQLDDPDARFELEAALRRP